MTCLHIETCADNGRVFCLFCGVEREKRPTYVEEPQNFREIENNTKEKYFQRALTHALGEEEVSDKERTVLDSLAEKAAEELGATPSKLNLKRFMSKQERSKAAVCRRHFPLFASMNGHPLPVVTSHQRRYMYLAHERAVLLFRADRNSGKKNISCRDVIRDCLSSFRAQGLLPLSPPR